eukprot:TRINITY_DN8040_c0_g1_i1.p1 TRINITY_DN8040_c0_g1~~TRINITY_DN8040_c0_g1_i1.p1  ORF type:complete len:207 (+),score=84.10 TRINITY_DN8040_c0_g1_i1:81-623(+)
MEDEAPVQRRHKYTRDELRGVFEMFDADGNGWVDKDELHMLFGGMGLDLQGDAFEEWFQTLDSSHDGRIQFDEFVKAVQDNTHEPDSQEEAVAAFKLYDTNRGKRDGQGVLRSKDFYEQVRILDPQATEAEVRMVFKYLQPADGPEVADEDYTLSLDDWCRVTEEFARMPPWQRQKLGAV